MKFLRIGMAAMLLWMITSCKYAAAPEEKAQALDRELAQVSADKTVAFNEAAPPDGNQQQPVPQQPTTTVPVKIDWDKKIIKNASLNIEVEDYNKFNSLVHESAKQWGGYVAQEEQQSTEYKKENTLIIKIPVDQFDNIVQSLTAGKEKVLVKRITSQDVTGEVVDTRARMEAKRSARQRYMDLLKQAKNMEEILQVQTVIDNIQVEIESASGRVNYLTHASAYSTIQLTFFQVINPNAVDNTTEPSFGVKVLNALKNGLVWMGDLVVLLMNLWPLALLATGLYWSFKKWRTARLKTARPINQS